MPIYQRSEGTDEVIGNMESTRRAVEEIIAGEEVDRSTPAEVIAGINAAMAEIEHLRELTQVQANTIFDMLARIDRMIKITEYDNQRITDVVIGVMDRMTMGGTHREKDEQQLGAINKLLNLLSISQDMPVRVKRASEAEKRKNDDSYSDVPF